MNESGLLFVQRASDPWKGMWDIPGGFCEPGEHPMCAARREVFEETGLRIEIVGFLGMWLDEYVEAGEPWKRTLNIYYHAVPLGGLETDAGASEVLSARFFPTQQLPVDIAFPGHVPAALEAWREAVAAGALSTSLFDRKRSKCSKIHGNPTFQATEHEASRKRPSFTDRL